MDFILHGYHVNEPTWFYLSLLLILAVFFRFSRFWSLRNLDLCLVLAIAPTLLYAQHRPYEGFAWLFVVTGLLMVRCLCDAQFTRRPRLQQNMNAAGLAFLCISAFAFLMTKVLTEPPPASTVQEVRRAQQLLNREDATQAGSPQAEFGPGSRLLVAALAVAPSHAVVHEPEEERRGIFLEQVAARTMAILSHLAVIAGLVAVAHWHYGDVQLGLAMATLYLLIPCTAYEIGRVNHVVPAALVVWAIAAYRRPLVSGSLLGLACGTLFFPVFLLPLWVMFYGRNGAVRFSLALVLIAAVLLGSLVLTSADTHSFTRQTLGEIDWWILQFRESEPAGFWSIYPAAYRIPVFVSFLAFVIALAIWPRQKNLGDLLAHSTALVIATQFWYPQQGGVYVLWYLPLFLTIVFRPQLHLQLPPDAEHEISLQRPRSMPGREFRPPALLSSTRAF